MINGKINASEYRIVSNCLLAMWMDGHLKDREYNQIMDRLNDYARECGECEISNKTESEAQKNER